MVRDQKTIRIGNGAGFAGDQLDAPRLLTESGNLDYLTLEYLAELTLSILAYQKSRSPSAGYIQDTVTVIESLCDQFRKQRDLKLITNGGGMNPASCVKRVSETLCQNGLSELRIACCQGDDLLSRIPELTAAGEQFLHLDSGEPLGDRIGSLASANVYLGAAGIVKALQQNAQIVITGRIADASLVLGPAIHEFGWNWDDYHMLGAGTVAGHLIECGAQVTGGMYSNWRVDQNVSLESIGYPIAELKSTGDCVITKPPGSEGIVDCETVAEQLIYEIGDPENYLTPDVTANFCQVQLEQEETDRVAVNGGTGSRPPERYKVSLAYQNGYATSGMILFCGPNAVDNARSSAKTLQHRMKRAGYQLDRFNTEILGAGDTFCGDASRVGDLKKRLTTQPWEVVLRVAAQDTDRAAVERLTRELAPLVTSGPPGVTGYTGARAKTHPVFAFWPSTISREQVEHLVEVKTAKAWSESDLKKQR